MYMMGCWSQLPDDLVLNIMERFNTLESRMYFQAVCMPWRRIVKEHSSLVDCSRLPWLLLPYCEIGKEDQHGSSIVSYCAKNDNWCRSSFSISENKIHHFEFPEAYGKHCCGSSYGWLTMVEHNSPFMFLLNPLTRCIIDLPPITTFPNIVAYQPDKVGDEYIIRDHQGDVHPHSTKFVARTYVRKVILTTDPSIPNCMAVAIYGDERHLAFCRLGDKVWTEIGQAHQYDVIFWRDQLYAVDWYGSLVACDPGVRCPRETSIIDNQFSSSEPLSKSVIWSDRKYLVVDSFGELLMVAKVSPYIPNHIDPDAGPLYKTSRFEVYRVDDETLSWEKVNDLGDHILFLGVNSAELFLAKEFPQCKANSIYFTDDYAERHREGKHGGHDLGIFSLKDRSTKHFPCCQEDSWLICPPPVWFTPSLHRR